MASSGGLVPRGPGPGPGPRCRFSSLAVFRGGGGGVRGRPVGGGHELCCPGARPGSRRHC